MLINGEGIGIRKNIINGFIVGEILELNEPKKTITVCTVIRTSKSFKPMNRIVFGYKIHIDYLERSWNELCSFILKNGDIVGVYRYDDFQKWEQKPMNVSDILEAYIFHNDVIKLTAYFKKELEKPNEKERIYLEKLYHQLEEESSARIQSSPTESSPTDSKTENIQRVRKLADKLFKSQK
ncbi:MAG: hypothetical protein KJ714_04175 [Euryarchaeota archaeon]|nr:hypothetical protein [Euryarchaeota archaeon]